METRHRRRPHRLVKLGLALVLAATFGVSAPSAAAAHGARRMTVDQHELDAALRCPARFSQDRPPVLLVHGTGMTYDEAFGWGFAEALRARGFDVCGVDLPGLSEPEAVRHYTRLSRQNYAIDLGLFPLGSCTMKHNPRLNEKLARLPGFADIHPLQPKETVTGAIELINELAFWLLDLTGPRLRAGAGTTAPLPPCQSSGSC